MERAAGVRADGWEGDNLFESLALHRVQRRDRRGALGLLAAHDDVVHVVALRFVRESAERAEIAAGGKGLADVGHTGEAALLKGVVHGFVFVGPNQDHEGALVILERLDVSHPLELVARGRQHPALAVQLVDCGIALGDGRRDEPGRGGVALRARDGLEGGGLLDALDLCLRKFLARLPRAQHCGLARARAAKEDVRAAVGEHRGFDRAAVGDLDGSDLLGRLVVVFHKDGTRIVPTSRDGEKIVDTRSFAARLLRSKGSGVPGILGLGREPVRAD